MDPKDMVDTGTVAAGAVADVAARLKGLQYPARKDAVVAIAKQNGADETVIDVLALLPPDRRYENPIQLFDAIGDEIRRLEG